MKGSAWYKVPDLETTYISVFKTSDDLWRFADRMDPSTSGSRSSRSDDKYFCGTDSWEEAFALGTTKGWIEGAQKMRELRKLLKSFNLTMVGDKRKKLVSPVGGRVHIPRFLAGDVRHMVRHKKRRTSDGTNVSIGVECGVLSYTDQTEIINRGVAVSALVKAIEDMGISVELTALHTASGTGSGSYVFTTAHKVKRAGSYCNDERIAMALAHPATHRRGVFSVRETMDDKIFRAQLQNTMGRTRDTPESIRNELGIDYHLGNINASSFCWDSPTAEQLSTWVMSKIDKIAKIKNIKTL